MASVAGKATKPKPVQTATASTVAATTDAETTTTVATTAAMIQPPTSPMPTVLTGTRHALSCTTTLQSRMATKSTARGCVDFASQRASEKVIMYEHRCPFCYFRVPVTCPTAHQSASDCRSNVRFYQSNHP